MTILFAQSYTISGYAEDAETGEKLISANVFDILSAEGTVTNTYGFFSLTLPADSVEIIVSYIGYQPERFNFYLNKNTPLNVRLSPALELETVVVTGEKETRIEQETQMSKVEVPVEQIKKIPALLGEVDVLKTIQLLPGVQSGGEGQSGLYVRGGSPDQNLILLDGVPVYNVSHVLGIFSVFNADAIKNITLTKGGFPARYGGRLSSILEINMKEGNMKEFHGEGSIGLITSKLTLEGPIKKNKASFLISGRRTYVDVIAKPIVKAAQAGQDEKVGIKLYFYDLNAKLNYKVNDKHRLYLSGYSGADVFGTKYSDMYGNFEGGIDWGNIITAARWNYQISPKLFKNTTLTFSNYAIDFGSSFEDIYMDPQGGTESEKFLAKYISGIQDFGLKSDFDYVLNPNNYIRFGAGITHHTYKPGALNYKLESSDVSLDTLIGSANEYSVETGLYIEDDMRIGPLKANIGLHFSTFHVNKANYLSLQPRIGLNYLLQNDLAIKGSFSTMTQYVNLLTSEALSLPTDLWVPSTDQIEPQRSWQVALGAAKTFFDEYEISLEGYYKQMENVLSFKEGASFLFGLENDWEQKVTQGDGESYGVELFLQKKRGDFTGWLGYTLSWNWRQFDEINSGKRYPFRYDRRHDISLVGTYAISDRISVSAAWIFGTGNAVTLPIYKYKVAKPGVHNYYSNHEIQSLGSKNAFRMSDYHRLDFSIEFTKQKQRWERTWVISVYNAYYHKNPYFILPIDTYTYNPDGNYNYEVKFKEITILPIIPSVSYKFKF
jgi:hypothetical protein